MRSIVSLALLATLMSSCTKEEVNIVTQVPEEKNVRFEIGRLSDYTQPSLADLKADVKLFLSFVDHRTGAHTIIWDTSYPMRSVMEFQHISLPMMVQKKVVNPKPLDQTLNASYNIRFWKGDIIQYQSASTIPLNTGLSIHTIPVNL